MKKILMGLFAMVLLLTACKNKQMSPEEMQHKLDSIARLDERRGIVHIRRHLAASPLFKGLEDFRHTRIEMLRAETVADLFAIMDRISGRWGASGDGSLWHQSEESDFEKV